MKFKKRQDGRYEAKVTLGKDSTGKVLRKSIYANTIKDLEQKISAGLNSGYDYIFCVVDMDTKDNEPECSLYQKLKA